MFKVPRRRSLLRGWRFDAPLTGISLVELLLNRARLRFTRRSQDSRVSGLGEMVG